MIITGASSGIGEATAKLLTSKGAKVVLGARREGKLKQVLDEIKKAGGHAVYKELDVTKSSDNDDTVKLAKDTALRAEDRGVRHDPRVQEDDVDAIWCHSSVGPANQPW